jgi:flagellar hook-length control protein FliK
MSVAAPAATDMPRIIAAAAPVPPGLARPVEAKRNDAGTDSATRPQRMSNPSLVQPLEESAPLAIAPARTEAMIAAADSAISAPLQPPTALEADKPATSLPTPLIFEAPRAAEAARPSMAPAAAPLVLRPHQVAEAREQIVLRASSAAADGVETISVDLRPPELGRVELRLTFREGTVQVSMTAERAETFEALRNDRANLEQQMQQAGLQLGGGGLDLQHGRLAHRDAEQHGHRVPQVTEASAEDLADEALAATRPRSDTLIDLIA